MFLSETRNDLQNQSNHFRWLVFDAVGTLIQPDPPVAEAYQSIAARHGSSLTVGEVGERFRQVFRRSETEAFPEGPAEGSPWLSSHAIEIARWRWIVREVIPDVDNPELCFLELWEHFANPRSWSCFDDVDATLSWLVESGYQLAIASNFDSRLHAVCVGHPPLQAIERRFVSSETGFRKPAPDFYARLIAHCDCPANEILMVGDDPEHDVAAPRAAGMRAVLIDRRTTVPIPGTIRSLHELYTAIH